MVDDRPTWARRMLNERQARGWSQADAIKAMRAHAPADPRTHVQAVLPSTSSLLRQYKRWEAGEVEPDRGKAELFYKPIIAKMFGTVTHAMFPVAGRRDGDTDVLAVTGMDTLELGEPPATVGPGPGHLGRAADHGGPAVLGVPVHAW